MLLPIDFVLARTTPTWREVVVGLDRGVIQPRDVLTIAHRLREAGAYGPALDDLLERAPTDVLWPSVVALAEEEPEQEPSAMLALWGDLALAWTWHYREALADPLATVAELWGDFDFPPAWEPFIGYLAAPSEDEALEAHRAQALARWEAHVVGRFGAEMV